MDDTIQDDLTVPADFRLLSAPMPPMLPSVVGVSSDNRFFRLNYEGSKPFWSDGRAGATFSYVAAYEPFVDHLAVAINLFDVSLGHDDEPPSHALLIDRANAAVYVGEYGEVCRFLRRQHPPRRPPTPEEIEEANKRLDELKGMSLDQLRDHGAFEFVFGSKPEQQNRCAEMVAWLDQYITGELIRAYMTAAEASQFEAFHYLSRFRQRIEHRQQLKAQQEGEPANEGNIAAYRSFPPAGPFSAAERLSAHCGSERIC